MDTSVWVKRLKSRLGAPPLELVTPNETIEDLCLQAIEKVSPYLGEPEYITGSGNVIDLVGYDVFAILHIYPTSGIVTNPTLGTIDEFAIINYGPLTRSRAGLTNLLLRNILRTEIQAISPEDWKLVGDKLYISGFSGEVTIEAITNKSIDLMRPRYQNWCLDYSTALLKISEGEILSRHKVQGSPVENNGENIKAEGIADRDELEKQLGKDLSRFYITR